MDFIMNLLTFLGNHIVQVTVGCLDIFVGVILLGCLLSRKGDRSGSSVAKGWERIFLDEIRRREDEVCLIIRLKDMMPVYGTGDFSTILGLGMEQLQEDVVPFGN